MKRIYSSEIKNHTGKEVTIMGFVQTIRDQGGIKFLILRDVAGLIQCVALKSAKEVFEAVGNLSLESVVEIHGKVKEEKQAPGGFEIAIEEVKVLSAAAPELPIPVVVEKGGQEPEVSKRFDWRYLDLRRPEKREIFKTWTLLEKGFRKYFEKEGFTQLYAPSIMSTASEGGADVFKVQYFDREAYLAQSPQFYKQMAMAAGFEKVFMVGPVFRAEPSYTTRHMTEFTGWDFEMSYIESHHDVMEAVEELFRSCFEEVGEKLSKEKWPRITIAEAKKKLGTKGGDLNAEEEQEIGKMIKEETGSDFVFLTDYPQKGRAFYHMRLESDHELTKGFDLIYKGLEVVTGAQREHRYDVLMKQAEERGIPTEPLQDYFNFFKYGCPPHGGAGIGPGRIVMKLLDLPSVKEATFLPRDVKRLKP